MVYEFFRIKNCIVVFRNEDKKEIIFYNLCKKIALSHLIIIPLFNVLLFFEHLSCSSLILTVGPFAFNLIPNTSTVPVLPVSSLFSLCHFVLTGHLPNTESPPCAYYNDLSIPYI